jgi:DNA-binding NarL/FixJ family response regulator
MIRVLIVDDHAIVRRGIKAFLAEADDIRVIGEAEDGLEAISLSA